MKICPKCSQTYGDETLNYCLMDGEVLRPMSGPTDDSARTAILSQPDVTAANRQFTEQQTARYSLNQPVKKSRAGLWLLAFFGVAIVLIGGGIIALLALGFYGAASRGAASKTPLPSPAFSPFPTFAPVPAP